MPTRPQTNPSYDHGSQNITGLDQWGWGDYGGGEDWWTGTGTDPASVPGAIGGWEDYSLGYSGIDPEGGGGEGLGPNAIMPFNWEDRETALAGTEGGLGSLFGEGSEYGLNFNPTDTANRSWRPTYDVTGPEGVDTGYHLGAETPHTGFPWVPGGYEGEWDVDGGGGGGGGDNDAAARAAAAAEAERARLAAEEAARQANLFNTGGTTTGFPADPVDDIAPEVEGMDVDVTNAPYPFTLPQMQTIGNIPVGDDPISNWFNSALLRMGQQGGRVPTDLENQTGNALSQILNAGGGGGALETPFGEGVQTELQNLITDYGAIPQDAQRAAIDFEQARSPLDAMREAQLSQGQAALADRNLLGQGPELEFMEQLEERLAPAYSAAGQRLITDQLDRADARYQAALDSGVNMAEAQAQRREARLIPTLQIASNQTAQQAQNMLDTVGTWTERQRMLGDLAIRNLDQNIDWSMFLAEFGLERDQIMELISSRRLEDIANLLNSNLPALSLLPQGMVPYGIPDPN